MTYKGIYYEVYGEGKPLVFLHGWGQSIRMWSNIIKDLSPKYKLVLVDLPGFGKSQLPLDYSESNYVHDIIGLLKELKLRGSFIVGHSFGGYIAYKILEAGIINDAILVGYNPCFKGAVLQNINKLFLLFPPLFSFCSTQMLKPLFYLNKMDLSWAKSKQLLKLFLNFKMDAVFAKNKFQINIIHGYWDLLVPFFSSRLFQDKYKGLIKLHSFKFSGHFPSWDEKKKFIKTLRAIIEE